MLIYLSILPVYLIIIHSVTSADLIKNKRLPRRNTQFTRTYDFNHPPVVNRHHHIPVTVIYDDDEVIQVRNVEMKGDVINNDEKNSASSGKTINQSVNPPSQDLFPIALAKDYEEEIFVKPKARSIKLPATESYETHAPEITLADLVERTGNKTRRRSQHVRKFKVDKSQFDVYVNETEITGGKVAQKESQSKTDDIVNEKSISIPKTFKRRKQLRDPVIPIINSENYVYSHSGNFHYSYEGGDGTKAYERGELRNSNGGAGNAVEGNFSYKDKDGNDYSLTYTADENGYRPIGDHLPTPPPIPPAIQRALDYLATKTTPEPITERSRKI